MPWVKDANGNTVWVNEGDTGGTTSGTAGPWVWKTIGGVPYLFNTETYALIPQAGFQEYQRAGNAQNLLSRFGTFFNTAGPYLPPRLTNAYAGAQNLLSNYQASLENYAPYGMGGGGGGGPSYYQYDPFSQQLQAAQLQENIRQANLAAGYDRSKLLNDVLANPANVFSSWFQSRGQVPPYNAQLANILNLNTPEGGAGSPWFGAMPPLGQTPGIPGIPTPQPPQPIPYAQGGTYIPAEPAVAIGLRSGQPLFTFNENAPAQTENVKITPQKTPSFAGGGTAWTDPSVGMGGQFRGTGAGQIPLSGVNPWPLQDFYDRGGPQFPWLTNLGQGGMPGLPQLGNALNGFPVPSLQSLNQMAPSEQTALANWFNAIQGGPGAEDVAWAARLPFNNLRNAIPAQNRMG